MGKSCWIARLADGPQTWGFYLFFPALSISAIHEVLGIKFKGGRSRDP